MPQVNCVEHDVQQVAVSWAEPGGRFTALFEAMVIAWLGEAPIKAVAELVGLTWDHVDGIQQRAIDRGMSRRKPAVMKNLGIDETSYQKEHEYVSAITDPDPRIAEDRSRLGHQRAGQQTLDLHLAHLHLAHLGRESLAPTPGVDEPLSAPGHQDGQDHQDPPVGQPQRHRHLIDQRHR